MNDTIKVKWYCGCYVGPPKWQSLDIYEPDECEAEGEIEVERRDWEERCVETVCTRCGALLIQQDYHFTYEEEKE